LKFPEFTLYSACGGADKYLKFSSHKGRIEKEAGRERSIVCKRLGSGEGDSLVSLDIKEAVLRC